MSTGIPSRKLSAAALAKLALGRRGTRRASRLAAHGARRGRPFLEVLEDRTLLSTLF